MRVIGLLAVSACASTARPPAPERPEPTKRCDEMADRAVGDMIDHGLTDDEAVPFGPVYADECTRMAWSQETIDCLGCVETMTEAQRRSFEHAIDVANGGADDDLAATDPAVREAAAARLRETYVAPSRSLWDYTAAATSEGDTEADIETKLPTGAEHLPGGGSGNVFGTGWQLDDHWALMCSFWSDRDPPTLREPCHVIEQLRIVWVDPPARYTGEWTSYYVNGQPARFGQYRDGKLDGSFVFYRHDGTVHTEQHYTADELQGETYYDRAGEKIDTPTMD